MVYKINSLLKMPKNDKQRWADEEEEEDNQQVSRGLLISQLYLYMLFYI